MVYPLAEQRMAAELLNPRQDEAVVLDLQMFAQAVVDTHTSLGAASGGALDLASLPVLLRDIKGGHGLLSQLGLKGRYYTKVVSGKTYVVFKGYSALRETLKGTRYLASNPQVVALGLGPQALQAAGRSNAIILITCYVTLDVMQFIMDDEQLYHELFANIITDVAIGTVALAAGMLVSSKLVGVGAVALLSIGAPIVVGLLVGATLTFVANSIGVREQLGAALYWTGRAVDHGLQETGRIIHEAQVSLRQKVEEFERDSNRFWEQAERETIWHFGGPDLYDLIYGR